jgi:hypothetical protein
MKLKTIIALALVATSASCGLDSKLDKLEKACKDKELKDAIEILEEIEKKYDEPKDWNAQQYQRMYCIFGDLREDLWNEDYQYDDKYFDEMEELDDILSDIAENLDLEDC